jgi:hypothetical protein
MAIHKVEVAWHDLREDPNDVPVTADPVFAIVKNNSGTYIDLTDFRYAYGGWEVACQPTESDPYPEDYEPISAYPHLTVIAWCDSPTLLTVPIKA